jgi:hypothetical protein
MRLAQPPVHMVMPHGAQAVFTIANVIPLAVVAIVAFRYARAHRTALPFCLLAGGLASVLLEPIVDVLGLCWFPANGQWTAFQAFDVSIPLYMLPVYAWFVGGQAFLLYWWLQRGVTKRQLFLIWVGIALVNAAVEIPGLWIRVYTYYGDQPFSVLRFPLWWTFCNTLMPMMAAAFAYKLAPVLRGWRLALLIPLVPMSDGLANGAVSWPTWLALNSGHGYGLTYPAAVVSLGLSAIAVYVLSMVVATDSPFRRESKVNEGGASNSRGRVPALA